MKNKMRFFLLLLTLTVTYGVDAATYYSNGSNAPNLTSSWTTLRNGSGTNPANFTAGDIFVIQNTHTMTTSATWAVSGTSSRVWIESGGVLVATSAITLATATTFQIDNGGTYKHQNGTAYATSIFQGTESFAANSTVELNNSNTTGPNPSGGFGNLTVNFTADPGGSVNLTGVVTAIAGNLTVQSTSIREFRLTGNTALTLTLGGDLIVSGGTLNLGSGTSTPVINLGGNWNQSGGTITMTGSGAQTTVNFTGSNKTFSQSTNANTKINFNINSGASVTMNSDWTVATGRTLAVSGTLTCGTYVVSGAGAFTLNSFSLLKIGSANGIAASASTGNIQVSGTRTFSTSGYYDYNGTVNQVTGDGLPSTVNSLYVTNTATNGTVTLSANCSTSNMLLSSGTLTTGTFTFDFSGWPYGVVSGSIDASSGTMSFGQTGLPLNLESGTFSAPIKNLILNNTGGFNMQEPITVTGTLTLTNGVVTSTSTNILTLGESATVSGGSTSAHISGPMRRTMNSAASFVFPIGKSGAYYPMTITASAATSAVVQGEVVLANAGGSGTTYINSLSTSEYWSAQLVSGIYIGTVSIQRPGALGTLSVIGRSLSLAGTYDNEGGTVSGTAINNSDSFTGNTSYFVMAEPTISCPKKTTITNNTAQSICTGSSATTLNSSVLNYVGSGTPTPQYQWYYNTSFSNTIAGATLISGATSSTYTPPTTSSEAGTRYYFCVAYATDNGCVQTDETQSLASEEVAVTVIVTPTADAPSSVTACDGHSLGALSIGNYFSGSGGTGTAYSVSDNITSSMTMYVFAETGTTPNCTNENSFTITINNTPTPDAPSNVTACDVHTLPALTVGNYFSGSGGTGTAYSASDNITSSMVMYVYAETGTTPNCSDENAFTITINNTPTADAPSNVTACDSYELLPLTVGNYFSGSGGTGTAYSATDNITSSLTMYVYAETGTTPNCTDENSFTITINNTPNADAPSNVTACDAHSLPALTVGNYFSGSGGTGTAYSASDNITSGMTMYVYAETGTTPNCTDENSFTITINNSPNADAPSNVTACDSYELLPLTVGNYFSGSGGTGTAYSATDNITSSMTMYVYAETGTTPNCTDENSFTITINNTPNADAPSNVTACDAHSLPALTVGNYFSGSGGTGTAYSATDNITSGMTMYVYAETGTTPNCTDENSFTITINNTPNADAPSNVTACDGHSLPALTVGNYFSGSGGTGTPYSASDNITSSMTMYVYAETGTTPNCTDENNFTITINNTPTADAPSNVTACDAHTLPALTVGNYFSGSGGTGTAYSASDNITSSMTMYVYTETGTTPNCTDENSFTITINNTPNADAPSNVTACNGHVLPALTTGNYFSGSGGTGTPYSASDNITSGMTMYVYAETGTTPNCTDENSFTITIDSPVTSDSPSDVRACTTYELPALSAGNNYFTGAGGTGSPLNAGDDITSSQTVYVRIVNGSCADESNFIVTIFDCIQLDVASCNTTLTNLTDAVYAETVVGATDYRFKIEHAATGYTVGTSTGSSSNFIRLSWLTSNPVKYGTTYTISASAQVGGLWMPFENTCTVTTPATRLQPAYANTTLTALSDAIYCFEVAGATNYRYEIRKASDNSLVTTSVRGTNDNLFRLSWVSGGLIQNNTGYKIRVSAYVGGSWQAYGPSVTINTPVSTKLATGSCGVNIPTLSTALYSDNVASATNYRYEIRKASDNSLVAVSTRNVNDNLFRLSWVSGIQLNTTYSIKVAAYVGSTWSSYGTACTVTTPSAMVLDEDDNGLSGRDAHMSGRDASRPDSAREMHIFPNPNNGNFTIRTNEPGAYQLLNELGQVIRVIEVPESGTTVVSELAPGAYFLSNKDMIQKIIVQ